MILLIAVLVTIFLICPLLVYFIGRKKDKKQIRKRSSILFNATVLEEDTNPETVFKELKKNQVLK